MQFSATVKNYICPIFIPHRSLSVDVGDFCSEIYILFTLEKPLSVHSTKLPTMVLLDLPIQRIKGRFFPVPLPPAGTFKGQTVLVTGGTAGLGLAAASHLAKLGADVIITCRTASRGDEAKRKIQTDAPGSDVHVMELDMARYTSCVAFVSELGKIRQGRGGLDVVVLNAGMLTPQFSLSPEGW